MELLADVGCLDAVETLNGPVRGVSLGLRCDWMNRTRGDVGGERTLVVSRRMVFAIPWL